MAPNSIQIKIVKRTGEVVNFEEERIRSAIIQAISSVGKEVNSEILNKLILSVTKELEERFKDFYPNVENIQDLIEKHLVKEGLYEIAKEYILYRAKRQKIREEKKKVDIEKAHLGRLTVNKRDGRTTLFDLAKLKKTIDRASKNYKDDVSTELIVNEAIKNIYDGIDADGIDRSVILATVSFIERDPAYSKVAARLFLQKLYKEVIGRSITKDVMGMSYREAFITGVKKGVEEGLLDKKLLDFNLSKLSYALKLERDEDLEYMGIQTLYERYFLKIGEERTELPQSFWMRVAMGLSINEENKEEKALEFYEVMSSLKYVPSTPTLFHSGGTKPQLSSCYLTTVMDDLNNIFKSYSDNAQLSKWSGGLGNDWTNIRSTGAMIKTTNVESQGLIPFLKIANDVTSAINRSGKRRGATCAYLETWHLDIEDFLDLRKNTGDDRRRAHDMNTSNWIPDLFMKRVMNEETWTLFSPDEAPDLHEIYGKEFEKRYKEYEEKAKLGEIKKFKVIAATKLWKKMLSMLFETGHPWITFKDPCNIRSPQDHVGVIHSSNLCTEITLNTSKDEVAVCNLGSINLEKHIIDGQVNENLIAKTVKTAIRMLDNVIDLNFYPIPEARNSNMKHRPIGLGIMGFQDALFKLNISFDSPAALKFSDRIMELISYNAILTSSRLAEEKGKYETYQGSKWDRGLFPIDTLNLLEEERRTRIDIPKGATLDWTKVREHVKKHGMRNSNTMAIAPTATIANISGCFPCIEPIYKNIYVKSNISGEFTVVNKYLIEDLKKYNLWNQEMLDQIKYCDGNLQPINSVPQEIKDKYKEAFEIDPKWIIDLAAVRGKWIDQSQSVNIFIKSLSGKLLSDTYVYAWMKGLKTTYYLRALAATQIEKSTLDAAKFGYTQKREYATQQKEEIALENKQEPKIEENKVDMLLPTQQNLDNLKQQPKLCKIEDPDCEACQ